MGSDRISHIGKPPVKESFTSDEQAAVQPVVQQVSRQTNFKVDRAPVNPWVHFVAGGLGGMAGALFTSPLDVVKTRMQSDQLQSLLTESSRGWKGNVFRTASRHVTETFHIIANIYRQEGPRALFKGLGPNLTGVVPARSINFFTYGLGKDFLTTRFVKPGEEPSSWIHLAAAVNAGIVTSTATNPIWLVKTRLQLDRSSDGRRLYKNSWDCVVKIWKNEGFTALYRGLSASYLGTAESSLQWVLYEQMKASITRYQRRLVERGYELSSSDKFLHWFATSGAAGAAKFIASLITYPHEVIRTRLRQAPMENGAPKYKGLVHCFKLVVREEGLASMYGGLTPHLLRTVPNSIIMFGTWDLIVRLVASYQHD